MSNFKTHLLMGIIISILYLALTILILKIDWQKNLWQIGLSFITIPFFSILPDIDQDISKPRHIFFTIGFLSIILFAFLKIFWAIIITSFILLLILHTKHRGFMHSIPFGLITCAFLILWNPLYAAAAFLSFTTHLALDKTTKEHAFPY